MMKVTVRISLLGLLALVALSPARAQEEGDPGQIKKIRDHYYGLNADLSRYQKVSYGDSLVAYLTEGFPEKVVVNSPGLLREYYFNTQRELLFAYEKKGGAEHRYYFQAYAGNGDLGEASELIRYLQPNGTMAELSDFYDYGLRVSNEAWFYEAMVEGLAQLAPAQQQSLYDALHYAAGLDPEKLRLLKESEASEVEEYEGTYSEGTSAKHYAQPNDDQFRTVLLVEESYRDGGHAISNSTLANTFWVHSPAGARKWLTNTVDNTHHYGVYSNEDLVYLLERDAFTSAVQELVLYDKAAAPVVTFRWIALDGHRVKGLVPVLGGK